MSRYQHIRRRWLAALRWSAASLVDLLASQNGMFPLPLPCVNGTAAPDGDPVLAFVPLTASERRAWEQLARELSARPKQD
jgi:hypothetical protein